jgi:hypothetical protein
MNRIPKDKSPIKSISHTGLVYKRFPKFIKVHERMVSQGRKEAEIESKI